MAKLLCVIELVTQHEMEKYKKIFKKVKIKNEKRKNGKNEK